MRTRITTLSAAGLLGLALPAHALFIDFETTPVGGTPTDDMTLGLADAYTNGTINVGFGWDTDGDLVADTEAAFEARGGVPGVEAESAYISGDGVGTDNDGPNDVDYSTVFDGGDWLLRDPGGVFTAISGDFLITYGGTTGTRNASGQVWDLDADEGWTITAFAADLVTVLDSVVLSGGTAGCCAGPGDGISPGDGRPSTFSFASTSQDIAVIRVTLTSGATGTGFGFDNFNATGARVPTIPEPMTVALLALGLLMLARRVRTHKGTRA